MQGEVEMAGMEMPKPGPAHKQLAKLAGNWVGEEKMHPSPWDPKGFVATGKVRNTLSLDGFCILQEYEQLRDGKTSFRGLGIFTWNELKKCNELAWCDSMGGMIQVFAGKWEGDVLRASNEGPMGMTRCSFDVSGNGYKFTMEGSQDGKQWATFMEGKYAK
jgi:hypothetical protein